MAKDQDLILAIATIGRVTIRCYQDRKTGKFVVERRDDELNEHSYHGTFNNETLGLAKFAKKVQDQVDEIS